MKAGRQLLLRCYLSPWSDHALPIEFTGLSPNYSLLLRRAVLLLDFFAPKVQLRLVQSLDQ